MPPPSALSEAQAEAVERISAGPRGSIVGPFVPMLRSPELMTRVQLVGEYLRFESALEDSLFELAILQTARHWDQQFEWAFHVPLALKAGVAPEVIEAIDHGAPLTGVAGDIEVVATVTEELLATGQLSDRSYERALAMFGEEKLVELLVTVGYYTTLALVMNAARTPSSDGPRLSRREVRTS
jgi:4-carboxymuconolactone decarboxylase